MKNYWGFGVALVAILGFGCSQKVEQKKVQLPVVVDVMVAKEAKFTTSIEVNGSVLPEEMVELHVEASGKLIQLNMPDGAQVAEGTILAKVNDADLQAQLEQQKVQLDLVSKTEERLRKLLEVKGVNQADYDAALSAVNNVKANIKVLNAQIEKTVVRAPFAGCLGLRLVSLGAFVNAQTVIGTLQQTNKTKIDFAVPEAYVNLVQVGNSVWVETNESAEKQEAVISAIEPQIDITSRNMKVRARLSTSTIHPGAFVKVSLNKAEQGILVPSNAIIPDANSNQVVVIKAGRAVFTSVETGVRRANDVQLLSGISAGDSMVVSGVLFVRPKAVVKIRKVVEEQ